MKDKSTQFLHWLGFTKGNIAFLWHTIVVRLKNEKSSRVHLSKQGKEEYVCLRGLKLDYNFIFPLSCRETYTRLT